MSRSFDQYGYVGNRSQPANGLTAETHRPATTGVPLERAHVGQAAGRARRNQPGSGGSRSSAPPLIITQSMLAELQEYEELYRELAREREEKRNQILELHTRGAVVEPGSLTVRVSEQQQRRLTAASLMPILGPATVEQLKNQVEPTTYRYVRIVPREA